MNHRRKRERALISLCSSLLLVVASCSSQNRSPANPNTARETVMSSKSPFHTKEPERYRATRTVTVTADGKTTVKKTWTAKDGYMRRSESEIAAKTIIILELAEGFFLLLPDDKVYARMPGGSGLRTPEDYEAEELLYDDDDDMESSFETLGSEVIGGRKTNKYRVVVNSSSMPGVSPSETLIWIDEALGMPIRSEGGLLDHVHVTMELSEIELDVDRDLFQIPEDYRKLEYNELLKRLNIHVNER